MKKKGLVLSLFLLILFTLAIASCSKTPSVTGDTAAKDPLGYFPLKEGNQWTYTGEIVTSIKGKEPMKNTTEMTFKVTSKAKVGTVDCMLYEGYVNDQLFQQEFFELTKDALIAHKRIMFTGEEPVESQMEPPETMIQFPMEAMKSWEWSGKMMDVKTEKETKTITGSFKFKVAGEEEVETPAGKFKTFRVEMDGTASDGSGASSKRWFAHGVGMVKEVSLVKFDVKGQEEEIKKSGNMNLPVIESLEVTGMLKSCEVDGKKYPDAPAAAPAPTQSQPGEGK
jgi:hypothetical protein